MGTPKVIAIGDNVVDRYTHQKKMYPGGNALNFAVYSKMLGSESSYIGVFGNDFPAEHIKSALADLKVNFSRSREVIGENGAANVGLDNGDRVFLGSNKGGISKLNPIKLSGEELEWLKGFDLLHTSINSYWETSFEELKQTGIMISLDFSNKITEEHIANICPYLDFAIVSVSDKSEAEISDLISAIHKAGTKQVIATMGSKGAIYSEGNTKYHSKAKMIEAVDTLGAGDAFIAAFLNSYIEDSGSALDCLETATEFATKICLVEGAFGYGISY